MKWITSSPYRAPLAALALLGASTAFAAPKAPTITSWPNGKYVNKAEQTITGKCATGNRIRIFGNIVGGSRSVTCGANTYSSPIVLAPGDGAKTVNVTQSDAGGVSPVVSRTLNLDLTAPAAPVVNSPVEGATVRSVNIVMTGTCENLATVGFSGNILNPGSTTVTCTGNSFRQSLQLTAGNGVKTISVVQRDRATNRSAITRRRVTFSPALAVPTLTSLAEGAFVRSRTQTVGGACVTGATVNIAGNVESAPRTVGCVDGSYSLSVLLQNGDGVKVVRVSQTNSSGTSGQLNRSITLDTVAPAAPTVTSPAAGSTVTNAAVTIAGACETNAVVSVSGAVQNAPRTGSCANGRYSIAANLTAGNGAKALSLAQRDRAGNTSAVRSFTLTLSEGSAPTGMIRLAGNKIYYSNGKQVIARGPELVTAQFGDTANIDRIAATGANAVRMLLTLDAVNGMTPEGFDAVFARARAHRMTVWVSLFTWNDGANWAIGSALGGGNFYSLTPPAGTGSCSRRTPGPCYLAVWDRPWLKTLMTKYKDIAIIDATQEFIGEEESGTEAGWTEWANHAKNSIRFFRSRGYDQPLEIMAAFQGRDLAGIVRRASEILAADTLKVNGQSQTLFGWQAYWFAEWYKTWQGELLLGRGGRITAAQAMNRYVAGANYPIQVGLDNYPDDTNVEYKDLMAQARKDGVSWLWWSWETTTVECPVSGATCQNDVLRSADGFAGAVKP